MEIPSVRILVVGDSGVGKSSLLRALCRSSSSSSSSSSRVEPSRSWTIGCDVHVLLQSQGRDNDELFVEFLDVAGHCHYELSRHVFYYDVHGVMFVHDLSNAKSGDHLRSWSREVSTIQRLKGCVVPGHEGALPTLHEVPKLVVGSKKDLVETSHRRVQPTGVNGWAEFRTVSSIQSSIEPLSIEPSGAFDAFLQQTLAFANRRDGRSGYSNDNTNSLGLRQTVNRHVDRDGEKLNCCAEESDWEIPMPPLSTGVAKNARSRWW